jgi:hypothetical protein
MEVEVVLEELLDTRVRVSETSKGGKITIDYADADDLSRVFQLLAKQPKPRSNS